MSREYSSSQISHFPFKTIWTFRAPPSAQEYWGTDHQTAVKASLLSTAQYFTTVHSIRSPEMPQEWTRVCEKLPTLPPRALYKPKKELPKGNWTYTLELVSTKCLGPRDETAEFIGSVRGGIIAEQGRPSSIVKEIGRLEIEVIQIGRMRDAGLSLSEHCEQHSAHVWHMYQALYDQYAGWRVPNSEDFDVRSGNLALVHSVRLERDWRGNGIGLLAVEGIMRFFTWKHHVIVMRPRATEEAGTLSEQVTMNKLAKHWALVGFEPCAALKDDEGVTEDMYMSLSELDESRMKYTVPHLFPRRREYAERVRGLDA